MEKKNKQVDFHDLLDTYMLGTGPHTLYAVLDLIINTVLKGRNIICICVQTRKGSSQGNTVDG